MKVKAILVAGGHGSRLYPFTKITQKTLLPIYDRPVIDYALGTIRRAGIKNITIISNQFIGQIAKHVGSGLAGEQIHYVLEETPEGVAKALNLARPHNENCRLLVYFSDNITTIELADHVERFTKHESNPGCCCCAGMKNNLKRLELPNLTIIKIVDIVEKPKIRPPTSLSEASIYTTSNFGHWSINVKLNMVVNFPFLMSIGNMWKKSKQNYSILARKRG